MLTYNDEKYLDYDEAASILHSAKGTIYTLVSDGVLKSVKIGKSRKKYIRLSELTKQLPEQAGLAQYESASISEENFSKKKVMLDSLERIFTKLSEDNRKVSDNQLAIAEHCRELAEPLVHEASETQQLNLAIQRTNTLIENLTALHNSPDKHALTLSDVIERVLSNVIDVPSEIKADMATLTTKWLASPQAQ